MAAVQVVRAENPFGVPGIHIEGPYFNPIKRGAHSTAYVRVPAEGELEALFSTNADVIRILTLAPEIFTAEQFRTINNANTPIRCFPWATATQPINRQVRHSTRAFPLATHLYNAMRGFESREPGSVGAIFDHPTVRASIIADSYHCNPITIRIAYRLLGERLFLISDALFANPPRPEFTLEQFVVHHEPDPNGPGRYVNNEGNLAGRPLR